MLNQTVPLHFLARTKSRIGPRTAACLLAAGVALGGMTGIAAHAQSASRAVSQAEWNRILADAKKEGEVVVYTTTAPSPHDRIKADFEKTYPEIKMNAIRIIGNQINIRVEQERAAGNIEGDAIITSEQTACRGCTEQQQCLGRAQLNGPLEERQADLLLRPRWGPSTGRLPKDGIHHEALIC